MYEVPKESHKLSGSAGVSCVLFALLFFVLEVFKCFERCWNDTSTSLNSEKPQNYPIRTKLHQCSSNSPYFILV
jgi:hypothetical protein